jgi:hypothetical protein
MFTATWLSRRPWARHALIVLACCMVTSAAAPARASDDEEFGRSKHGGKGYFMIGWSALDLQPLNDALVVGGYPAITEDFLSLGGGGHAVLGRLVLGAQGHGYLPQSEDAALALGNYRTEVVAGAGFVDLGFLLWSRGGASFTPLVGLGGGGIQLDIRELSAPTFGQVLAQPGRRSTLTTGGFLIDLGASFDWILDRGRVHGVGHGGPLVGLRAGWVLSPFTGQWELNGQDIAGGPELGLTGPYLRFMFGGGGYRD